MTGGVSEGGVHRALMRPTKEAVADERSEERSEATMAKHSDTSLHVCKLCGGASFSAELCRYIDCPRTLE